MKKYLISGFAIALTATASYVFYPKIATIASIEKTSQQMQKEEFEMKKKRRQNGYHKANQPDEYDKYFQLIRTAIDEDKPSYLFGYQLAEYHRAVGRLAASRTEADDSIKWVERGPSNVPGRTRTIIIDPADATRNTWIVGAASGGIWRTTNGGTLWTNLTPNLPNLATNALAMSASNQNVIYAGTGEGYGNVGSVMGNGIFKSTNRGNTWQALSSTSSDVNFAFVTRLVVAPTNENLILASTATGIQRSTDGGATWTTVFKSDARCEQIIATQNNFNVLYATVNGGQIWKSTDAGLNWNSASEGIMGAGRIELAIAPQNPNKLYASAEVSSTESAVYVSENAGALWQKLDDGKNTHYLAGQGWYDNAAEVSPNSENSVFIGGVNAWRVDLQSGTKEGIPNLLGVSENGTRAFLSFVTVTNFSLWGGKLQLLNANLGRTIEIRFGVGLKQKAHRFLVPQGSTSGVPAASYSYQDYVDVPFQAWDMTTNKQVMISFRDQRRDGAFELETRNDNDLAREYVYVHAIPYNEAAPSTEIAKNGGHETQTIYSYWPLLTTGATWIPTSLPNSTLRISYGTPILRNSTTTNITDGYNEFSKRNGNDVVHVDHHSITFAPINNNLRMIITTDGGMSVSDDGGNNFSQRGDNYNTTQCYGVDKAKGANQYAFGAQDNGCWFSPAGLNPSATTGYTKATGGDGFEVAFNATNPSRLLTTSQFNELYISRNSGVSFGTATSGMTDKGKDKAPFISRIGYSARNPETVFMVGNSGVWKSTDFGASWKLGSVPESFAFRRTSATETASASSLNVRVSDANSQIVWAGGGMTAFTRICVSNSGGDGFVPTENYRLPNATADFPMGGISGLQPHPTEQNTAFAIFSLAGRPKILRTKDLGRTWQDLTGFATVGSKSTNGFPDVSTYSVFVFPRNPKKIWAGTEIGIFESLDEGATWKFYDNFPAVVVWNMKLVDNQVVIATHGRGVWTGEIPSSQIPLGLLDDILNNTKTIPLSFYPNPATSQITLHLPDNQQSNQQNSQQKYALKIYNLLGQVVKAEIFDASLQNKIDVSNLSKGVYVIYASGMSDKLQYSAKLLIE